MTDRIQELQSKKVGLEENLEAVQRSKAALLETTREKERLDLSGEGSYSQKDRKSDSVELDRLTREELTIRERVSVIAELITEAEAMARDERLTSLEAEMDKIGAEAQRRCGEFARTFEALMAASDGIEALRVGYSQLATRRNQILAIDPANGRTDDRPFPAGRCGWDHYLRRRNGGLRPEDHASVNKDYCWFSRGAA